MTNSAPSDVFQYSIVIPAYNEAERIGRTLDHILAYVEETQWSIEIIVVDDGSTDATVEIVSRRTTQNSSIRIIENPVHQGKGYCVRAGVLNATGKVILTMDADLPAVMEQVRFLTESLAEGADIAIGSRWLKPELQRIRQPFLRQCLGRCFNVLIRLLFGLEFRDTQCGFKVFTHQAARLIFQSLTVPGWAFDAELLVIAKRLGLIVREVPVEVRHDSRSKLKPISHAWQMFAEIIQIKWYETWGKYPDPATLGAPSQRGKTAKALISRLMAPGVAAALILLVLAAGMTLTRHSALQTTTGYQPAETHSSKNMNVKSDSELGVEVATARNRTKLLQGSNEGISRHLLSISYDRSRLGTRQLLLEQAGYKVTSAFGLPEALKWYKKRKFDLIVMGHTIPRKEKRALIGEARKSSDAPVLSIRTHGEPRLVEADYSVDSLEGDSALLTAVDHVLAARAKLLTLKLGTE